MRNIFTLLYKRCLLKQAVDLKENKEYNYIYKALNYITLEVCAVDEALKSCVLKKVERTRENLRKNNIESFYVQNREQVLPLLKQLIKPGSTVSAGGSVTLSECNVLEFLKSGQFNYLDRYEPGLTRPQIEEIFRKSFFADVYVSSSNAITEKGELFNVDGNSNRVAAILYGPKEVILVCGINKIVSDLDAAVSRLKTLAAPANSTRLGCDTPCEKTGKCAGVNGGMTDGCASDARICCNYVVSAKQRHLNRIKVIFVGESLGY